MSCNRASFTGGGHFLNLLESNVLSLPWQGLLLELHLQPQELDQPLGALLPRVPLGAATRRPGLEGGHITDLSAELGLLVARYVPQPSCLVVDEKTRTASFQGAL